MDILFLVALGVAVLGYLAIIALVETRRVRRLLVLAGFAVALLLAAFYALVVWLFAGDSV